MFWCPGEDIKSHDRAHVLGRYFPCITHWIDQCRCIPLLPWMQGCGAGTTFLRCQVKKSNPRGQMPCHHLSFNPKTLKKNLKKSPFGTCYQQQSWRGLILSMVTVGAYYGGPRIPGSIRNGSLGDVFSQWPNLIPYRWRSPTTLEFGSLNHSKKVTKKCQACMILFTLNDQNDCQWSCGKRKGWCCWWSVAKFWQYVEATCIEDVLSHRACMCKRYTINVRHIQI